MIDRFVFFCIRNRRLILAIFLGIAILGYYSWTQLAVEAYPDIADVTSQVITQYPGHAAEEIEQQITIPLERELTGVPGLQVMRSKSTFGLSLITLVFRDGVDDYWARQRIRERITDAVLPAGVQPGLDPLTSPIGEIYRYTLESPFRSERELREYQEWVVIPRLKQVFGVADVTNFGGEASQFQLLIDPSRLAQYNVSLQQVNAAIQANNANSGGSVLAQGEQSVVVRGIGLIRSLADLGNIVVSQKQGTPIFLKDLGALRMGALERRGILGKDDNPASVSGIVLLLKGENPSRVLAGIHQKVTELNSKVLPPDIKVVPYLDRTTLVNTTLHTVLRTLAEGFLLVVVVLLLFLGDIRSALVVAITIPLAMLVAFILMYATGIPANLLSLGAIDFGILVDSAVVFVEAVLVHREADPNKTLSEGDVAEVLKQVARPIFFARMITITAYLPLFAFQRVEKKLFAPMAYTVSYALGGALLIALALIPSLTYLIYRSPRRPFRNSLLVWLRQRYEAELTRVVARPRRALVPGAAAMALAVVLTFMLGREFLPYLDEGSIWLQVQLPPAISLPKASQMAGEIRSTLHEFPEVSYVVTQLGRNDDGTDPWTFSHIEASVGLKPYSEWGGDKQALIERMDKRLRRIPGIDFGFSQPMIDGVNDKIAGAHSQLVVKIFGNDFAKTRQLVEQVRDLLASVPGAADVSIDQEPPLPQLQITINRAAAARFGINVSDISDLIQLAVGGQAISQVFVGERRYDLALRFADWARNSPDAIANLTLATPSKARVPLSEVASVQLRSGESTITREMGRRHLTVKLDVRGRDLASFLSDAQQKIDSSLSYDKTNYEIVWGGQFENQQRAQARLALILPTVLGIIFVLLYAGFGSVRHAGLILVSIPMALLGGVVALYLRGMTFNVSSAVGFIALFGVAVLNGVIMVANLNRWRERGLTLGQAVIGGASERLRPVLMTATVATLGLLPAALARGIGSDVQRPLATVVVGGLISATALTLIVLPALYYAVEARIERRRLHQSG
jgi:cobalt-zinc-cadmium resistance protein CzcA